jgi:Effector protein/RTX calcium-binding nonapeptide repeat (4 copies)
VGRGSAVELARRAARLSALVAPLAAGWVRQRQQVPISWRAAVDSASVAVGHLVAVVEGEVDRLYLAAFAAARARMGLASNRPARQVPATVDYPAAALAVADELTTGARWWGRRARVHRRLAADLRSTVRWCRQMIEAVPGEVCPEVVAAMVSRWDELARRWQPVAQNAVEPYRLPAEPAGTMVFHDGNRVVISTGTGDDRVSVESDPALTQWRVVVNGQLLRFPAGTDITVRTGPGDDHVTVSATVGVTVLGGAGNDELHGGDGGDRLYGGPGNDYLDGGGGDDVLSGGPGDDVIYGGGGADIIHGGPGADYLDGGDGPDLLDGGDGPDILCGGAGDDVLDGGAGDDRLYPGPGRDVVDGGAGTDVAYLTRDDRHTGVEHVVTVEPVEPPATIRIVGGAGFVDRVRADLQLLAASPVGRRMLAALGLTDPPDHASDRRDALVIIEDTASSASMATLELPDGRRLSVFTVTYDPARGVSADHSPPIIGLFHELAHVYDFAHQPATGEHHDPHDPDRVTGPDGALVGTPNDERAAVGLPIDHDADPATPNRIDPNHPYELTENALRDEMGLPRRQRYGR